MEIKPPKEAKITPIRSDYGILIHGIDLSKEISQETKDWILTNIHKDRLMIFRDQNISA